MNGVVWGADPREPTRTRMSYLRDLWAHPFVVVVVVVAAVVVVVVVVVVPLGRAFLVEWPE